MPTHHIIVRLAGVVTQTFEQAAIETLFTSSAQAEAANRLVVHNWAIEMQSGRMTFTTFCSRVASLTGMNMPPEQAYQSVSGSLKLASPMIVILREISEQYDLWLFCEGDRLGILPSLQRLDLGRFFQPEHWLFTPELGFRAQMPELIPELLSASKANLDELLWVDDRSMVTSAATRAGLNAITYVDPFRFRRNLLLRGLVEQ